MKTVFLVGYMGVGKTTIGKNLSKKLGLQFIDLDKFIENRYRKTIKDIFEQKGEDKFRSIEREMLYEVASFQDVLIATGGGTPCYYDNMDTMNKNGITVYIKSTVEQLTARLLASKNIRPIIEGKSPKELSEFIATHLAEREKYYEKAKLIYEADILVTKGHVHQTAIAIKHLIETYSE